MNLAQPSPTASRAATVLERLLLEPEFRSQFRAAPVATLERSGMHDLARGLRGDGRALQTLELRAAGTSIAAVLMSAAVEGLGLLERLPRPGTLDRDAEEALRSAIARPAVRRRTAEYQLPPAV